MGIVRFSKVMRVVLACAAPAVVALPPVVSVAARAQAPAAASSSTVGTVKAVSTNTLTVTTANNGDVTVTSAPETPVLQIEPGAKSLAGAKKIALTDISAGDRVLVSGRPGESAGTVTAARIVLMKSADLASLHANQAADWQRRGSDGVVRSVSGNDITVARGARTVQVTTTPQTVFRRYSGDSVKFEDAQPGTLAQIQPGDQLRVRGDRSADGGSITAEEIVSGSFENLAGTVSAVDAGAGTLTIKDLATKKSVVVHVTANSNLHHLPAEYAARFARRSGGAGGGAGAGAGAGSGGAAQGGTPAEGPGAGRRYGAGGGGGDLSAMLNRLPTQTLAELKPNDAVLIVASKGANGQATAITMLSGVEQILSSTPSGEAAPTLSPWNLGGGGGESGEPGGGAGGR